ncbi:LacI family DNA-binding transcriptional regulator [Deinococcus altitudinis]|uniref:LacI family DNA-binding transcriptional regulator n=1 Tax=Deinococcus altitudinis TaxID=468914 RepID=UPI0038914D9D
MQNTVKKRPTQKEVAERAGVSQGVVSQVLNGRQGAIRVNPDTRERVLQTIEEMGYAPNIAARSLVGGRTHIMGVFTYEPVFPTDTRNFFYPFLEGIEDAAAALNYDLLLHTRSAGTEGGRRVYQNSSSRLSLTDGTLILGELGEPSRVSEVARLIGEGHPLVFLGRRELPGLSPAWVAADYVSGTQQVVDELMKLGHRRLLYLGGTRNHESAADREAGYRQGMRGGEEPARVRRVDPSEMTPELAAQVHASGVTGLLIENDELAVRWLETSAQAGLSSPQHSSFVVLGDPLSPRPGIRPWAALEIPRREMGRAAVRVLNTLLNGGPAETLSLPCRWVPGDTLGRGPHGASQP